MKHSIFFLFRCYFHVNITAHINASFWNTTKTIQWVVCWFCFTNWGTVLWQCFLYMFLIVFASNIFNLKGLGLFNSWAVYGWDQVMDCLNVRIYFFGRGAVLGALKDFSFWRINYMERSGLNALGMGYKCLVGSIIIIIEITIII